MYRMTEHFSLQRSKWTCPKCGKVLSRAGGHPSKCGNGPERFWAMVDKGPHPLGCWLYRGFIKWDGYGWLCRDRRYMTAHRYAWILKHGEPQKGLSIRHKCDVAACCNPDHLELGTHKDNMRDMHARERAAYGERNPKAKLTYAMVEEGRRLHATGMPVTEIHRKLKAPVTYTNFLYAIQGKKWKVPHAATPSPVRRDPRPRRES